MEQNGIIPLESYESFIIEKAWEVTYYGKIKS